MQTFDNFIN